MNLNKRIKLNRIYPVNNNCCLSFSVYFAPATWAGERLVNDEWGLIKL